MAGLHTKTIVIFAYTVSFLGIIAFMLVKQRATSVVPATEIATEVDIASSDKGSMLGLAIEKPIVVKKALLDVSAQPTEGVYKIYTKKGLKDFVAQHRDKLVVVKFANINSCDPYKSLRPTYLLSAKWLPEKAYFAEIDENEFDDLSYFKELAPIIPAFKIYKDGKPVRDFQGLKSRTHIRDELALLE